MKITRMLHPENSDELVSSSHLPLLNRHQQRAAMDISRMLHPGDSNELDSRNGLSLFNPHHQRAAMDITRMVHPENSDEKPEPINGVVIWPTIPTERAVSRPRPPRPRKLTAKSLHARVDALELVAKHLSNVLHDLGDLTELEDRSDLGPALSFAPAASSTVREGQIRTKKEDNPAKRIREFLTRTILLTEQEKKERAMIVEHLRLLKHHKEARSNLSKLMAGLELNGFHWMSERWRAIASEIYEPLPEAQCYALMQETLEAIKNHKFPEGKDNGAFGWRDWVHLDDDDEHYVRFMTRKTLQMNMEQLVAHSWSLYSDGDAFKAAHLGENCEFFHQVLQQISPDAMIIQRVEKYPDLEQMTHTVAIAFRVKTETGYMIVYRCIESPQLQRLMKSDGLSLCGTFLWDSFDVASRNAEGECDAVQFTAAGSIGSDNPAYAKHWRDEIVIILVRYEIQFIDKPLLSSDSCADETSAVTSKNDSDGGVPP